MTVDRPFVTARSAADTLGGRFGGAWIVYAFEVEGERLEMHRKRLASTSSVSLP